MVAQRLRAFSLPTIPTLYCHLCTSAHLSAYYLLVRLRITLRLLSNVTISTAQYLPIYLYARACVNSYVPMRAIYPYVYAHTYPLSYHCIVPLLTLLLCHPTTCINICYIVLTLEIHTCITISHCI